MLWLFVMTLYEAIARRGGRWLWEHPADPGPPFPSVFASPEFKSLEERTGAKRILLDQCMYQGKTKKSTCFSTTWDTEEFRAKRFCDGQHIHETSEGKTPLGEFRTRALET